MPGHAAAKVAGVERLSVKLFIQVSQLKSKPVVALSCSSARKAIMPVIRNPFRKNTVPSLHRASSPIVEQLAGETKLEDTSFNNRPSKSASAVSIVKNDDESNSYKMSGVCNFCGPLEMDMCRELKLRVVPVFEWHLLICGQMCSRER
jgi:hypothetical protein